MMMPGRKYTGASGYRYGFNGQEKEVDLNENLASAEFWMYDSRLGRRWNVDPVSKEWESVYSTFSNNPIFHIDPNGATATPPEYHQVKKGETLSGIAKKFNTTVESLAIINGIKDVNKINVDQILVVGSTPSADESHYKYGTPEVNFRESKLTGYNNPNTKEFGNNVNATVNDLAADFVTNVSRDDPSSQNTLVVDGPLLEEIKQLPSVNSLISKGIAHLNADKKLEAGEYYKSSYSIGSLTGSNGRRIIWESVKDLGSKKLRDNKFFSAENWLGSYGFSMRVTGTGEVAICIYDSKSTESATDRRNVLQKIVPNFTTTYQRYLWYINVNEIKNKESVYEN